MSHNKIPKDTVDERRMDFHMQGLSRAENAKDIGDCTVVRLGFVTSLMHDAYNKGVEVGREKIEQAHMAGYHSCCGRDASYSEARNYFDRTSLLPEVSL